MGTEKGSPRRYFSSRKGSRPPISIQQAHSRLDTLYALYRDKDYFIQKLGTGQRYKTSEEHKRLALITLGFNAFPVRDWLNEDITEDHLLDVIEFLFDHVSKPGMWIDPGYDSFDEAVGKAEFRSAANSILAHVGDGFELGDGRPRTYYRSSTCSV
jgi:hypothetical protein